MQRKVLSSAMLLAVGVGAGVLVSHLPVASASGVPGVTALAHQKFMVSINEVRQSFVSGQEFSGHYSKTVTLSDGSKRHVELIPTIHDGMQVIELKDNGGHTYMSLDGTTTNGTLMVQVRDVATMRQQLAAEGWPASAAGSIR